MSESGRRKALFASQYMVPPVQRALRLLRHIADGDPVIVHSQTAKRLGINRTTLMRLLVTLEAEGMIEKRRDGIGYVLGLGTRTLCASGIFSADVMQVADPVLVTITERLGLSSHLAILDGHSVVYVLRRVPNLHLVSNIQIGSRLPAHAVNVGRIILAYYSKERVESLFVGIPLQPVTDKTPLTVADLHRQIEQDRQIGMAWSDSFFEPGISSVAAPVFDQTGSVVAAINVTGPTAAFCAGPQRRKEIGAAIVSAAEDISRRLGWMRREMSLPV